MEMFRNDGHLTDEGMRALIREEPDELQRLEAAEHLGFCDECLLRYTAMLTDDVLLAPETPQQLPVMRRVRQRKFRRAWARYATVAAAAVLAVGMWVGGGLMSTRANQHQQAAQQAATAQTAQQKEAEPEPSLSVRMGFALGDATGHMSDFLGNFIPKSRDPQARENQQADAAAGRQTPADQQTPNSISLPADDAAG